MGGPETGDKNSAAWNEEGSRENAVRLFSYSISFTLILSWTGWFWGGRHFFTLAEKVLFFADVNIANFLCDNFFLLCVYFTVKSYVVLKEVIDFFPTLVFFKLII